MSSFSTVFTGCFTKVGRKSGQQIINLRRDCWNRGKENGMRNIKHEILHTVGFFHEMIRSDRDHHITIGNTTAGGQSRGRWTLDWTLLTNYDINSIMHYPWETEKIQIQSLNEFYNLAGFSQGFDMTATDKISLNILYNCSSIKMRIFSDYLNEEAERTYIELMQLQINPNEISQKCVIKQKF